MNADARPYRSGLRQEQAAATRARILEATLRLMGGGIADLSMPAVARAAGVSVPTVYRHFGTKADLLAALYPHVARRSGLDAVSDPRSIDELRDRVRALFGRLDDLDDLARAALASPLADAARRETMPERLRRIRALVGSIEPPLAADDAARIVRLLVILTSSSTLRIWRDLLGSSVDEAAGDVEWAVRAAVAASAGAAPAGGR